MSIAFSGYSQCVNDLELFKIYQEGYAGGDKLVEKNTGWSDSYSDYDNSEYIVGYPLGYSIKTWTNNSSESIQLLQKSGKKNIIIFSAGYSCYKSLSNSIIGHNEKTKAEVLDENNYTITRYCNNNKGFCFELRNGSQDYILIYDKKEFQNAINLAKSKEEKRQLELVKAEALFYEYLGAGDSLLNGGEFVKAQNLLNEAKLLKPEYSYLVDEKLAQMDKYRWDDYVRRGDELARNLNFVEAGALYQKANELFPEWKYLTEEKITGFKEIRFGKIIKDGDQYYFLGDYSSSLERYYQAKEIFSNSLVQGKIRKVEAAIKDEKTKGLLVEAKSYMNKKQYSKASDIYEKILRVNNTYEPAKVKLKELNTLIVFLEERKTKTYNYRLDYSSEYNQLYKELKGDVLKRSAITKKGEAVFSYNISFDTIGNNKSSIEFNSISDGILKDNLLGYNNYKIKAPEKNDYFVFSKSTIAIKSDWNSKNTTVKSRFKGEKYQDIPQSERSKISTYLNGFNFKHGDYRFLINTVNYNDEKTVQIKTLNYKVKGGPGSVFYSILIPGLGTIKATYGEKGRGRTAFYLVSTGIAFASKLFSDQQYSLYLGATEQNEIDDYYNNANAANKSFIIFSGLSATIYVYDVFWVLSKGFKNVSQSKENRKKMRQNITL